MSSQLAAAPTHGALRVSSPLAARWGLSDEKLAVVRSVIAPDAPDDVLDLYFERCKIAGCDPFSKMIYCINRPSKPRSGEKPNRADGKIDRWSFQSSIDLFRSIADQSGEYTGQVGPFWCGEDGVWTDVWLARKHPAAAKVGVLKRTFTDTLWAVARWDSYVQTDWDGNPSGLWKTHGDVMIAKTAEALALRKAFPQKLQGLYTSDEMSQADRGERDERPAQVVSTSPTVTVPQPALVTAKADAPRAKSPTELAALFDDAKIPGAFKDWLVEHIAPDLPQRAKKVLTAAELLEAERQIAAYVAIPEAEFMDTQEAAFDEALGEIAAEVEAQRSEPEPAAIDAPKGKTAPFLRNMIDSVAAEIGVPPSDAAAIEARVTNGAPLTTTLAKAVVKALRDVAEGKA